LVVVAHKIQAVAILYLVLLPQQAVVMEVIQVLVALVVVVVAVHLTLPMLEVQAHQVKALQVAQELQAQVKTRLVVGAVLVLLVLQGCKTYLLVVVEQELAHQLLAQEFFMLVEVVVLVKAQEQYLLDWVRLEVAMENLGHLAFLQLPQLLILALVAVVHFGQTRLVLVALAS
jgi:hypothetical protein